MTPNDIDKILAQATNNADVDASITQRAKGRTLPSLNPVRPLAPAWVFLVGFLIVVFGAVAGASASVAGMQGWHALNVSGRAAIFAVIRAACFPAPPSPHHSRP